MIKSEARPINKTLSVTDGIKDSIPISLGYIPIAITFGLLAKSYGIPNLVIVMMSAIIYAGSSQFMGIKLISMGTPYPEIILTTFMINLRNFLTSSAMAQRTEPKLAKSKKALIGYMVTDETFAVLSTRKPEEVGYSYLVGLQCSLFFSFNIGTFLGVYMVSSIQPALMNSLGIAIYAMFISVLLPSIKKSRKIAFICAISIIIAVTVTYMPSRLELSTGWIVIITAILGSSIGGYIHMKEDTHNE